MPVLLKCVTGNILVKSGLPQNYRFSPTSASAESWCWIYLVSVCWEESDSIKSILCFAPVLVPDLFRPFSIFRLMFSAFIWAFQYFDIYSGLCTLVLLTFWQSIQTSYRWFHICHIHLVLMLCFATNASPLYSVYSNAPVFDKLLEMLTLGPRLLCQWD